MFTGKIGRRDFYYASSDEKAVLAQAFEEHRDNLRNSQSVFLIVWRMPYSEEKRSFFKRTLRDRISSRITEQSKIERG